ncbi:DUF4926 domain-containing protein [candidate division KSB1 bacterium]|nr:DUF4926 domain-containing protein [candidate division KSB1 bacterium]
MNKPDLFDVVELQSDLPELGLERGAQGTVVECYPDGEYEIEFVDEDGQTLALCALPLDKISVVYQANTKQKRQVLQQLVSIMSELDEERARKVVDFADSLRQPQAA